MRISRDKLNKLAHTVADTLADIDEVGFLEDRNTIRQEARKALENLLTEEARIDTAARQRSLRSARSSSKARRSGKSSTASTTTRKCASWGSERAVFGPQSLAQRQFFVKLNEWPRRPSPANVALSSRG